ncbi:MAG: acyl--CoA ligase [Prevotella sp.]|nr:acyl--CoA ligase [Prevotella sp.]
MRLEDYLEKYAIDNPDRIAIICGGKSYSYGVLYDLVRKRVQVIHEDNDMIVVFRAEPCLDFFINYFAIHKAGCVAVPLSQDVPGRKLDEVKEKLKHIRIAQDTADILFTTGTTGKSKGVMISHRAIIANAENLIEAQHYTSELSFILTGPLDHIGCLSKVFPLIVKGATINVLDGMKDMNAFYKAMEDSPKKVATFLVPASIRMLLKFSADCLAQYAAKIEFIETGGAAISKEDINKLCDILPYSRLYNTYASTEAGVISTYNFNDGKRLENCIGKVMKNSAVSISETGTIVCKGATIMSGYAVDDKSIDTVLHDDALYTHDLGYIGDNNLLYLSGRDDDIINIGGYKVAPTEVESAAIEMEGIEDCICIAVDHPISGKALKLLVVRKGGAIINNHSIAIFLKSKLESYKVPLLYQFVDKIKRTFNGKLDRKAYVYTK